MMQDTMVLRQVAGDITKDGGVNHQIDNFKVARFKDSQGNTVPGHYQITFDTAFTNIVSVVATPYAPGSQGNALNSLIVENFSEKSFDLYTVNSNGRNADQAFSFIALGQQRVPQRQ